MNFKVILLILTLGLSLFMGCAPNYKTDFAPPDLNASVDAIFPPIINDLERKLEPKDLPEGYKGYEAIYGDYEMTISVIYCQNNQAAEKYFTGTIVAFFDDLPSHFRGKINGKWSASGTDKDKAKWYSWVNQNWIFVLFAKDQKSMDTAIANFAFISK